MTQQPLIEIAGVSFSYDRRPVLTGIRLGTLGVGAWLLIRISEVSGMSIDDLRRIMGDQRQRLRVATARPPR